ncbi:MAG: 3-hydroxyacyl-CoA dehydrogenase family protein [Alphaproteobacteria bacterium]|nr:3-hydroxyacyl-CoA dehydrogenase family protein [Alphaproteobacteria bacterium]MCB9690783.1 3-hydroxyacyl-CoA dehydrogenase family protein [Alphaproteobacteria bacterium]
MRVGVVGAGTMGHGIAQVAAMAGYEVVLTDVDAGAVERGIGKVRGNLDKGVEKGKVAPADRDAALAALRAGSLADVAACDLQIEAVPEKHDLKVALFRQLEATAAPTAILATNTSSLSVGAIAAELAHPERVIGTHFFNPVHIMALLEVIVAERTAPEVLEAVKAFGQRIGKDVIVVKDAPGFATSRLGVCLGMEAIRMVEQGVASPEDIDKAMVLGYRHPVGPLKLTDMVGLDVRMHIGEYLAGALGNPAFEPPELMRRMVAEGRLGKKSGRGFYDW